MPPENFTRGQLFKWLRETFDSGPSGEETTDKAVEFVGEAASIVTLFIGAYQAGRQRLETVEVSSEVVLADRGEAFVEQGRVLESFANLTIELSRSLQNLESAWRDAYRRVERDCKQVRDSEGNTRQECKDVTNWYEPPSLKALGLNRHEISRWLGTIRGVNNTASDLQHNAGNAFDLSMGSRGLAYERQETPGVQLWGTTIGVGTIGFIYALYENIGRKAHETFDEVPLIVDDERGIKRRTVLKLIGALAAAFAVIKLADLFAGRNAQIYAEVKAKSEEVIGQIDVSDGDNFRRFFGLDPGQMLQELENMGDVVANVIENGNLRDRGRMATASQHESVISNLRSLLVSLKTAIRDFTAFFDISSNDRGELEYTIPQDLTEVSGYLWGSREIQNYVNRREREVRNRPFVNYLIMSAILTGAAVVTELSIAASDGIMDS
jgi:hypothetical protein